jgi:predicted ABC-type ATPase
VALQAGRIMLERMEQMVEKMQSFAFETTLSGLTYMSLIKRTKDKGYRVTFFFVYLNSVDLAIERVALRVSKGGHPIAKDIIYRRYYRGLKNMLHYAGEANAWYIYDNSGTGYELIAKCVHGIEEIINFELFETIIGNERRKKS